jgi:hypothetical protein
VIGGMHAAQDRKVVRSESMCESTRACKIMSNPTSFICGLGHLISERDMESSRQERRQSPTGYERLSPSLIANESRPRLVAPGVQDDAPQLHRRHLSAE